MSTSSHASTAQAACEVQTIVELHTLDSATPEHSSLTDSLGGNEIWCPTHFSQYQPFFAFSNELCYGYLRFEGNGKEGKKIAQLAV